jgi:hypothetical protein
VALAGSKPDHHHRVSLSDDSDSEARKLSSWPGRGDSSELLVAASLSKPRSWYRDCMEPGSLQLLDPAQRCYATQPVLCDCACGQEEQSKQS